MRPDRLDQRYLEVNGFRRVGGGEFFVEWRDVGGDRVATVWIEYGARGPPVWDVHYEVKTRGGDRLLDQGDLGSFRGEDFDEALEAAVSYMRRTGSGEDDTSGDVDITGGL